MQARTVIFVLLLAFSTTSVARGGYVEQPPLSFSQEQSRTIKSRLDFKFDAFREVLNLDLDVDQGVLVFADDIYYSKEYVDVIVP
jgi:hypothetical protein